MASDSLDPRHLQRSNPDGSEPIPGFNPEAPLQIELDDVPPPPPKRAAERMVPALPQPGAYIPNRSVVEAPEEAEEESSHWHAAKKVVGKGFFDPFQAFEEKVELERFKKAQIFLALLSFIGPLLLLLLSSFLAAIVYQVGAAFQSVTPPNPFYEVAIYPLVYVFAKGYWVAYLILPIAVFALGWLWAATTGWLIARSTSADFTKMLCILTMLGTMLAPFTMFPFFRLVVLGILIWYTARRMSQYFDVSFWSLAKFGGVLLLGCIVLYTLFERKVESFYPANQELSTNLRAFYFDKKKLEWPDFGTRKTVSADQVLWENLGSLDALTRQKAVDKAMDILKFSRETPEIRFRLALRMAEEGNSYAMAYVSRSYKSGQGVPLDNAQALTWIHKATEADPKQLEYGLDEAHLLCVNNHVLDGKRRFVALAKENLSSMDAVSNYLGKTGYGAPDRGLMSDVLSLYRQNSTSYSRSSRYSSSSLGDKLSWRTDLLQQLSRLEHSENQWFLRAMMTEYGNPNQADPEVYGESSLKTMNEELNAKIELNDPQALGAAGDKCFVKGDLLKAREYWHKSSLALTGDKRRANAPLYLKLAESYDPGTETNTATDPRESTKYYLGYILLADNSTNITKPVLALKRLGVVVKQDVNVMDIQYLTLCSKYDVPEAWAIMGSCYVAGGTDGVQKNLPKARECFQKAKTLGYQGPVVNMLDGDGGVAAK